MLFHLPLLSKTPRNVVGRACCLVHPSTKAQRSGTALYHDGIATSRVEISQVSFRSVSDSREIKTRSPWPSCSSQFFPCLLPSDLLEVARSSTHHLLRHLPSVHASHMLTASWTLDRLAPNRSTWATIPITAPTSSLDSSARLRLRTGV